MITKIIGKCPKCGDFGGKLVLFSDGEIKCPHCGHIKTQTHYPYWRGPDTAFVISRPQFPKNIGFE